MSALRFERISVEHWTVNALVDALRDARPFGDALVVSLSVAGYDQALARSRPQEYQQVIAVTNLNKFDSRRTSQYVLRATLPEICREFFQADVLGRLVPELIIRQEHVWRSVELSAFVSPWSWQRLESAKPAVHGVILAKLISPLVLQGLLVHNILTCLYGPGYSGTVRQAKDIARAFCESVLEDREQSIVMFATNEAWCPWFYDMHGNWTYFWIDPARERVWLLCITDTD